MCYQATAGTCICVRNSPIGFLDGSWWHRSYWVYGKGFAEGAGGWPQAGKVVPAGHLLVFDGTNVYGYGRQQEYYKWTTPVQYQLFAMGKNPIVVKARAAKPADKPRTRVKLEYKWTSSVPFHVHAIALADRTLFVAGPAVVMDEEEVYDRPADADIIAKLQRTTAALEGKAGALLWAVSASDGDKLAVFELESPPVWDGMAVATGRLYLSMKNGRVLCLAKK